MLIRFLCLAALLTLGACTDRAPPGGGDIVLLGDSIMAWNGRQGQAIGDVIEAQLGRDVIDRAVPGAQFANGSAVAAAAGFDIRAQFPGGRWNWVVLNGGANDLGFDDCGCGACGPAVDALIGSDARSGSIPPFLETLSATGTRVLWMGYYASPGGGSFEGCRDDLVELEARIARYAAARDGVFFIDGETVIDRDDLDLFAADRTHPSPRGSALLGTLLATEIALREGRSQTRR